MSIEITEQEAQERLNDSKNLANLLGIRHKGGYNNDGARQEGRKHVTAPENVKIFLGAVTQIENPSRTSGAFGVNEITLKRLSQGCSDRNHFDEDLKEKVDTKAKDIREDICETALDTIRKSIESINMGSKLEDCKPREAAATAKDLASVIEKMGPSKNGNAFVTFNIYAPAKNKEDKYRAIEVETTR